VRVSLTVPPDDDDDDVHAGFIVVALVDPELDAPLVVPPSCITVMPLESNRESGLVGMERSPHAATSNQADAHTTVATNFCTFIDTIPLLSRSAYPECLLAPKGSARHFPDIGFSPEPEVPRYARTDLSDPLRQRRRPEPS